MPVELYLRGSRYWCRGYPADGDSYIRQSLGTSDEAIAQAAVREIEAAYRKRRILGPDAPRPEDELTFAACVMLYEASPKDARYLKPIVRRIGASRVRDLTPQFVRKLARDLYPHASTDTWQRQVCTPVRSVINNAHELGKCPPIRIRAFSKAERVRQDERRGKQSRVARTPGSWEWVLAFCAEADPRDKALAYFMFRHGYRVGQSVAMTRSDDMDLAAGRVRVHSSKGHPAHWVQLDPEEVVMIANIPTPYQRKARNRVFGIGGRGGKALYSRWQATCERAGIAYLPPHSAGRHGYGTEMVVRQRVDPVSAALDKWSDPSVLLKTYAHSDGAAEKVRAAFRAGLDAARTPSVQPEIGEGLKAPAIKGKLNVR